MEYNEPLNLSIKKKPIAVVTPSSSSASNKVEMSAAGSSGSTSNDADDPSENLDTPSPSGVNESDNMNRSSPITNPEEINICHTANETASVCSRTIELNSQFDHKCPN